MDTLIIGCGAAGAAAAIAAAERGDRVTVLDRNRKPLKKLGVTGNGRGNLMNNSDQRYYGDTGFACQVLEKVTPASVAYFLESCGITLAEEEEGRVYPAANLASVAVDGLLHRMAQLGVEILSCACAEQIVPQEKGFSVTVTVTEYAPDQIKASGKVKKGEVISQSTRVLHADRVIVAAGGAAAPAHGTDGSAYSLLTGLGHTLRPVKPALCALLSDAKVLKGLSGKRLRGTLQLVAADGRTLHTSTGEVLFADDGISGIAAMQLARFWEPGCTLHMDLSRSLTGSGETQITGWLDSRVARVGGMELPPLGELLVGCAHPAVQAALLRAAGLRAEETASPDRLRRLGQTIVDLTLPVTGTRDFDQAQVTAGGILCSEFDPATMESRLIPGLYAAGEMLDVDGDCGGYNLMFAFASGLLAGRHRQGEK
ncbi:MAG: aminoacetone oxidase family FAD-binding enzyme [Clostridia bacterium]|nr:aminoacetone oxidase family FAD-binding enzyme [Clostridia bacterium]